MSDLNSQPTVSVELFVRSLAPVGSRDTQNTVVEQLHELTDEDRIAGFDVYVTGRMICPDAATAETAPGKFLLDRIEAFETWADRTGRSVSATFRRVADAQTIDGADCSGIRLPTMAIAEYEDGEIRFVAPTETTTVSERIQRLTRVRSDSSPPLRRPPSQSASSGSRE